MLVSIAMLLAINPFGYFGGNWDDGRYLHTIMQWVERGPIVGINHWGLRWPVVMPTLLWVSVMGLGRAALMVSPALYLLTLVALNYGAARRFLGMRAAAIGIAALVATPELMIWATRLNPDIAEVLFWSAALWAFVCAGEAEEHAKRRIWLLLAGIGAGLAWATRETSLGLVLAFAIAFVVPGGPARRGYVWIAAGFALIALPEMIVLGHATGDPLYRIHVDLRHTQIHSNDLIGGVTQGASALFNSNVMQRWTGAGPVHLHWAIDPWINFFANFKFGLAFPMATGLFVAVRKRLTARERRLIAALVTVALCNILTNLYIIDVDPKVRMFMPALVAACLAVGVCGARLTGAGARRALFVLLGVKLFATFITVDVKPNFADAPSLAGEALSSVRGPVFVNQQAWSHLYLASAETRARLRRGLAPPGAVQMTVGIEGDLEGHEPPPAGIDWHVRWQRSSSQVPLIWPVIMPACRWLKIHGGCDYKAVRVSLYQRRGE